MENPEVTAMIDGLRHPLEDTIRALRQLILEAGPELDELIKWNAPSYRHHEVDCLTMKLFPPKKIQLIFHRGAAKLAQPPQHFIDDPAGILTWAANDRAIATFSNPEDLTHQQEALRQCILDWCKQL